ncbi:hypothetical protein [Amycolatopsis dongchuanensis]|uniref:Uncharacterized protein n=1 Tax=Amycolatopsis dongchuanensis TaxID=1070866 RepID=A0ABP9R988_9PSEU
MTGERRAAWFPPALLGFALLAATAWELRSPRPWFAYTSLQGFHPVRQQQYLVGVPYQQFLLTPPALPSAWRWGTPWQLAVAVAFLGALVWYRRRIGSPGRVVLTGVAGLAVIALSTGLAAATRSADGQVLAAAIGAPLGLLGLCAGAWAVVRPGSRVALRTCLVCLPLAAYALGAALRAELVDPVTAALGLAALAWLHRSVVLAVVVAGFLLAAVALTGSPLGLLVPGAVALAGALAVLVSAGRTMAA